MTSTVYNGNNRNGDYNEAENMKKNYRPVIDIMINS